MCTVSARRSTSRSPDARRFPRARDGSPFPSWPSHHCRFVLSLRPCRWPSRSWCWPVWPRTRRHAPRWRSSSRSSTSSFAPGPACGRRPSSGPAGVRGRSVEPQLAECDGPPEDVLAALTALRRPWFAHQLVENFRKAVQRGNPVDLCHHLALAVHHDGVRRAPEAEAIADDELGIEGDGIGHPMAANEASRVGHRAIRARPRVVLTDRSSRSTRKYPGNGPHHLGPRVAIIVRGSYLNRGGSLTMMGRWGARWTAIGLLGAVGILAFESDAFGGTFKWVDRDGNVRYTDRPPQPDEVAPPSASVPTCAGPAAPSPAMLEFMQLSGLHQQLEWMAVNTRSQLQAQLGALEAEERASGDRVAAVALSADRLHSHVRQSLSARVDDATITQAAGWFRTTTGRKITAAEIAAAMPQAQEDIAKFARARRTNPIEPN